MMMMARARNWVALGCLLFAASQSVPTLADIGIDWSDEQHGVIFRHSGEVHLVLCPGELPDHGKISRDCGNGKAILHISDSLYTSRLLAMGRLPAKYQSPDGLIKVSEDLELDKRKREQSKRMEDDVRAELENKIRVLEEAQRKIRDINRRLLAALEPGETKRFYREYQDEWNLLFSSFSPVWYTGKRRLKLSSGNWEDQQNECFSPWKPWRRKDHGLLEDILSLSLLSSNDSKVLWTGDERQPRIVHTEEAQIGDSSGGKWHVAIRITAWDELGHSQVFVG